MKKYLIIAPKPSVAKTIENVYKNMGEMAEFTADVVSVNCHVVDMNSTKLSNETLAQFKSFTLKKANVPPRYKISAEDKLFIDRGAAIKEMVKSGHYTAIINACDPDTDGDLEFQYMIESLGLERCRTERVYLFDLEESLIESELMTLNDF